MERIVKVRGLDKFIDCLRAPSFIEIKEALLFMSKSEFGVAFQSFADVGPCIFPIAGPKMISAQFGLGFPDRQRSDLILLVTDLRRKLHHTSLKGKPVEYSCNALSISLKLPRDSSNAFLGSIPLCSFR